MCQKSFECSPPSHPYLHAVFNFDILCPRIQEMKTNSKPESTSTSEQ